MSKEGTDLEPPADRGPGGDGPRGTAVRRIALAGPILLLVSALLTLWDLRPPAPVAQTAPETEFSAERAHTHVEEVAAAPHPVGTEEHERALGHVVDELDALGLDPEIHESTGIPAIPFTGTTPLARVRNVVAVIEGDDPTGRVFLTAHYDSVASGPGANDDAVGVATVLEAARAMTAADEPPRNDVVLLLTDAEEAGLLGAEAFTNDHPLGAEGGVVLNHEARGAGGTVTLFRATPGSGELVRLFAETAPHPVGDSFTEELFALLPNDTDFTAFDKGGFTALDYAYAGRAAHYHSPLDTPENADSRSLQQMGDNSLAFGLALAEEDLAPYMAGSETAIDPNPVYFNVPPGRLVHFPASWAPPMAGVALALTVALVVVARRRGLVTIPRVLVSFLITPLLLVVGAAAGIGFWQGLVAVRPGFAHLLTGSPYEPTWFAVAALLIGFLLATLWLVLLRRWPGTYALAFGGLLVLGTIGALVAVVAPGASSFLVLPTLAVAGGGLFALAAGPDSAWRPLFWTVSLVPAAVLLWTMVWSTLELGLADGLVAGIPLLLLGLLPMAPLVESVWPRRRALLVPASALVVAVACVGAGIVVDPHDAERPLPARLTYTLDTDADTATWSVPLDEDETEIPAAEWAGGYVGEEVVDPPAPGLPWPRTLVGEAEPIDLPAPELEVVSDTEVESGRLITLELSSPRGAESVGLHLTGVAPRGRTVIVEGREVHAAPDAQGRWGFRFLAPPPDRPIEVELVVDPEPVTVMVEDSDSLPTALDGLPGYEPPPAEYYLLFSEVSVLAEYEL